MLLSLLRQSMNQPNFIVCMSCRNLSLILPTICFIINWNLSAYISIWHGRCMFGAGHAFVNDISYLLIAYGLVLSPSVSFCQIQHHYFGCGFSFQQMIFLPSIFIQSILYKVLVLLHWRVWNVSHFSPQKDVIYMSCTVVLLMLNTDDKKCYYLNLNYWSNR